jgi:hypothetical protein
VGEGVAHEEVAVFVVDAGDGDGEEEKGAYADGDYREEETPCGESATIGEPREKGFGTICGAVGPGACEEGGDQEDRSEDQRV